MNSRCVQTVEARGEVRDLCISKLQLVRPNGKWIKLLENRLLKQSCHVAKVEVALDISESQLPVWFKFTKLIMSDHLVIGQP